MGLTWQEGPLVRLEVEYIRLDRTVRVQKLLAGYRDKGTVEEIARHTESEFDRITKQKQNL